MQILHEVDQPGSDIDHYLQRLESILDQKKKGLEGLIAMVGQFKSMMKV